MRDVETALDVLTDALNRCRREDMRAPEVFATLDFPVSCAFLTTIQQPPFRSIDTSPAPRHLLHELFSRN
jgi:hypothetical protein